MYSRSRGPFRLKSAMEHSPSGSDARQSTEKPLRQAQWLIELIFICASHHTGLDIRSITRKSITVRFRGREDRTLAKARALLEDAGHRSAWCNVGLMSLAGHGHKYGSRHGCLIIA